MLKLKSVYAWYRVDYVRKCLVPFAVLVIEDERLASTVQRYLTQLSNNPAFASPYPYVWAPISRALQDAYPGRFPPFMDGLGNKLWVGFRLKPFDDLPQEEKERFKDLPVYVV
jgi:hypothetical protein